ncbi:hypothetical protein [Nitrosopumilus sp.]|uniref:hypothetical protein n=1 Tax=Nitrosopumilus sp. TaxID=2024843 RepID=UPI00247CE7F2|nr:hypothetical protein [Nitrosopumilus sp.]MCV0431847.1 hypothetical protein [Nitrosopumilus sp.]
MSTPPESVSGDEICPMCGKPKKEHNSNEIQKCSEKLVEMGIMRYCGLCGLTKPADGMHDRCEKCGEKYSFSNS